MAKRFLKFNTKNRPDGVDKNGVFTGAGGAEIVDFTTNTNNGQTTCSHTLSEIINLLHEKPVTFRLFLGNDSTLSNIEKGVYTCSVTNLYHYDNPSDLTIYFPRYTTAHVYTVVKYDAINGISTSLLKPTFS